MTEKSNLEDKLSIKEKEIAKQEELKNKYSKTLRIIRKRKKQEEELLVVAYDGKSVHRPKCIAVRNIPKDNRKLIANWKTAEKEGYRGCGLCRPHIMPKVVVMGSRKYKFVASKDSDKVHKLSCVLVKNIKDKDLFTTYKQALKKGYTACRVCISEDKK
jgi:methylphosphotriester-DNA--protein-cysteine methyltransferase